MANTATTSGDSPLESLIAGGHKAFDGAMASFAASGKGKRQTIPVACAACQRRKSKCDGIRPTCSTCRRKVTRCAYDVKAGETRADALRKKYDALASDTAAVLGVLNLMRAESIAEAEAIFRQVRSAPDIASLVANIHERPARMRNETSSVSSEAVTSIIGHDSTSRTDLSFSPLIRHPFTINSKTRSTPEVGLTHLTSSVSPEQPLPHEDQLRQAVDAFFASAGKLFHVFSHEQGMLLFDRVYRPTYNTRDNAAICELTALGALGCCYYQEGVLSNDGGLYYSFAKHYLEDSIHAAPLGGMRSCALIAMCNIMDKPSVALAYIDLGLSSARQKGLRGKVRPPEISRDDWIDGKKVWRTLTTLSDWLAASMGVVSDAHKPLLEALSDIAIDGLTSFDELVQTKVAEISVITATILRTVYGFKIFSPHAARLVIDDIEAWYLQLPPSIELRRLLHAPDSTDTHASRGPALFVHLLYLGALHMLFRRIVAQAYYLSPFSSGQNWMENKAVTSKCLEQGIDAATQSARVLYAMRTRIGIYKHCWLVICQSYWSCTILLYSAAKCKARYHFDSLAADYVGQAEACLAVLDECGQADFVARAYHSTLRVLYDKLVALMLEQERSTESQASLKKASHLQLADVVLGVPRGSACGLQLLADALRNLLRGQQDGDIVQVRRDSKERAALAQSTGSTSSEPVPQKLDWRFEGYSPFNWTRPQLVPLEEGNAE